MFVQSSMLLPADPLVEAVTVTVLLLELAVTPMGDPPFRSIAAARFVAKMVVLTAVEPDQKVKFRPVLSPLVPPVRFAPVQPKLVRVSASAMLLPPDPAARAVMVTVPPLELAVTPAVVGHILIAAAKFVAWVVASVPKANVPVVEVAQLFEPLPPAVTDPQEKLVRAGLPKPTARLAADPTVVVVSVTTAPPRAAVTPTAGYSPTQALIASVKSLAMAVPPAPVFRKVPAVELEQVSEPLPTAVRVRVFDPTVIVAVPTGVEPENVPATVAPVELFVSVNVLPPFVMVALPLVLATPVKVPVWDAVVGALAVRVTEFAPFVTVTVSPPFRLLLENVPVSVALVAPPV